jgi:hypothetical protein
MQHPHPDRPTRPDGCSDCCTNGYSTHRDIRATDGDIDCHARANGHCDCDADFNVDRDANDYSYADTRAD